MRKIAKNINLALFFTLLLTGCSTNRNTTSEEIISFSNLLAEGYDELHPDYQLAYLESENYLDTSPYCGNLSRSAPLPVTLSWESNSDDIYEIHISKDEDFSDELIYKSEEQTFDFYNSELGATYYWKIVSKGQSSLVEEFIVTSKGPRNLFIEGVENIRDLGSWGHIKQGLIYRSGRFNEEKTEEIIPSITENGLFEMNNHLKIKTEIDLRRITNNEVGCLTDTSVLGENVNYIQIPMAFGGNNILTFVGKINGDSTVYDNPVQIKAFFEVLADENNYPIDFHCSIGKDRTGCMAYLIEGLLGLEEEFLYRDYMFTNFANAGYCKSTDISTRYVKTLTEYEEGDTLQEKIYNYLSSDNIGVSTEDLDKIIDILKVE